MKRDLARNAAQACLFILLLLSLILSSCSVPGIVATDAQLPAVKTTPQTISLPPVRFPQDEAAHRDLTEWWYYTGREWAGSPGSRDAKLRYEYYLARSQASNSTQWERPDHLWPGGFLLLLFTYPHGSNRNGGRPQAKPSQPILATLTPMPLTTCCLQVHCMPVCSATGKVQPRVQTILPAGTLRFTTRNYRHH